MAVNVNRSVSDPFYRYKMPRLLAKVEGKGNGIKTVIANMTEIAKALERPPTYPTKYFGCELGAQTNFDLKNERYIVNGEHDANKLQDILDGFIKKFVLCPACENPETTLTIRRNQINSKCKACGHAFLIDNKHRLSTFILKNPPKVEVDFSKAKENGNGAAKDDDEKATGESVNDKSSSDGGDVDDEDWAPEPLQEQLAAGIGKLVITKDLEKSVEERLDMLYKYFVEAKTDGKAKDGKALVDEAERLELKQKAPLLLADALLDENIMKDDQLTTFRKTLLRFTLNDKKAQRYLLGGIEQLIVKHEALLLPKAAHIIKKLYDADIVEEEVLLAWGEKPSSKYVTKTQAKKILEKAKPVLDWLGEAEEESEAEDSDEEIGFEDVKKSQLKMRMEEEAARRARLDKVQDENGDEIDIENI